MCGYNKTSCALTWLAYFSHLAAFPHPPQRNIFPSNGSDKDEVEKCFEIKTRPAVKYMKPFLQKKLAIKTEALPAAVF